MNITFRQLRLVATLAETGSVSAAARAMHVTQPTASMQLREVTDSVGLPIYEIVAKRVQMTEVGLELAKTARTIASEWDTFTQTVDRMNGLTCGKLRVAVVSTAKYFVLRLLSGFCAKHSDIEISLEVLNRDGVVQRLRDNLDDLYVMSMPPVDIEIVDEIFMPNPLVVIAPKAHTLSKRTRLTLGDLRGERFILRERGSGTRMAVGAHLKRHRFTPNLRLELGNNEAIKEAVAGGLGIAIVSAHALAAAGGKWGLAVLKVTDFPIKSAWHVVYRKGKHLSPIADVFRQHLLTEAEKWAAKLGE